MKDGQREKNNRERLKLIDNVRDISHKNNKKAETISLTTVFNEKSCDHVPLHRDMLHYRCATLCYS